MSFTRPLKVSQVSNVAANSSATLGLPVGPQTYESVNMKLTDIAKTEITNIQVLANGKPIQSYKSVTDLETIQKYYGYHVAANEVELNFKRKHFSKAAEARVFNMGVMDLETAQIAFEIGNAGASPDVKAYAPRYTHTANGRAHDANKLGTITKVKNFVFAATGAGTLEIENIPKEMFLQALHIKGANVTRVTVEMDGNKVWELDKDRMQDYLRRAGRTPQDGWYHIDWMLDDELGNQLSLRGLSDFRLILEVSGAESLVVYSEYLSGLGGI